MAALSFVLDSMPLIDTNLYIEPRSKGSNLPITDAPYIQHKPAINNLPAPNRLKLLYYVNKLTGVYWLCISLSVALDIFAIAYRKGHLGFSCCYKIIACS